MLESMHHALIVDPEKAFRKYLSGLLARLDMKAVEAEDLRSGTLMAQDCQPKLVILDHALLRAESTAAARDFKELPCSPEIIITLDNDNPDGAELALDIGAWDYIRKTDTQERLLLTLDRAAKYRDARLAPPYRTDSGAMSATTTILTLPWPLDGSALSGNAVPNWNDFRRKNIDDLEKFYLVRLMSKSHGDVKKAVEFSGLSQTRLYALLRKHCLKPKATSSN